MGCSPHLGGTTPFHRSHVPRPTSEEERLDRLPAAGRARRLRDPPAPPSTQFQAELREPAAKVNEEPLRVLLVFEADDVMSRREERHLPATEPAYPDRSIHAAVALAGYCSWRRGAATWRPDGRDARALSGQDQQPAPRCPF